MMRVMLLSDPHNKNAERCLELVELLGIKLETKEITVSEYKILFRLTESKFQCNQLVVGYG